MSFNEKKANILSELRRFYDSPMSRKGLFGKAVKDKLKGRKVLWHGSRQGDQSGFQTALDQGDVDFIGPLLGKYRKSVENMTDPTLKDTGQNVLARLYSRFGNFGKIDIPNPTHGRIKDPAAIFDITGSANERGASKHFWHNVAGIDRPRVDNVNKLKTLYPDALHINARPSSFGADKLREAAAFPAINKTRTLAEIFPNGLPSSPEKARAAIEDALGRGWIVKSRHGLASADTNLTDKALGKDMLTRLRDTIRDNKGTENVIVQRRSDAKEIGPIRRLLDKLAPDIGMGKKEYRVHVVNGQVVPYATYGRGNVVDYVKTLLNPFRDKEVRSVEKAVQQAVNQARKAGDRTRTTYGFDVGIDKKGKPFIVETNPSEGGIASSWFDSPFVADSVISAAKGELPRWVKIRNALYGTGTGAGVAGLGYHQLQKSGAENADRRSLGRTLGALGLGALSADTGWNAVQIARDASHMRDLHNKGIRAFQAGGLGMGDKARLLEGYADAAGKALNRRVLGLPAHHALKAFTPSADASILDRLRMVLRLQESAPGAFKEIADSRAHYSILAKNPRLGMLREIMTDDPTTTKLQTAPRTDAARAIERAMGSSSKSPDIPTLFGGSGAAQDGHLRRSIDKRFSEFFLGGQSNTEGFSKSQAKSWGLSPYARAMRPAAAALGAASLLTALGAAKLAKD